MRALLLALLTLTPVGAANSDPVFNAPATNWVLPVFSPLGYRSFTLRGDEARLAKKDEIDVTNINITVFTGDAAAQVTSIVLSPQATYFPSRMQASGPSSVRIIRTADGTDAYGENWTYDFKTEKVSLRRNVRIVFKQQLNDFLK
jgi:hypothetical protein